MILIDRTIVSDSLVEDEFVCHLDKCKGACCIEGISGAPLEDDELQIIDDMYEKVKPYMTEAGIREIEKQGKHIIDSDGDHVTPLIDGKKECAYTVFENGIAKCSFEKAYYDGAIDFKKPVSCHLYPVRITKHRDYDAVNYEKWNLCKPACSLGKSLGVPVYKFVKDALIRKYGQEWYDQLEGAVKFSEEKETIK
jgi:hypothetical protein